MYLSVDPSAVLRLCTFYMYMIFQLLWVLQQRKGSDLNVQKNIVPFSWMTPVSDNIIIFLSSFKIPFWQSFTTRFALFGANKKLGGGRSQTMM